MAAKLSPEETRRYARHLVLKGMGGAGQQKLKAARALSGDGIDTLVVHFATIKPLDAKALLDAAKRAGRVVTVEEHQAAGGFGSAVAELLSQKHPVPLRMLGAQDRFGQSGTPEELIAEYGLDAFHIKKAVLDLVHL